MEGILEGAEEVFTGERFLEEEAGFKGLGRAVELFGVSGHEDDFKLGEFFLNATSEFGTSHAGHHDIGDEKMDGVLEAFGNFEGFDPVGCGKDLIAGGLQEFASEGADGVFVFDEKDSFAMLGGRGKGLRSRGDGQLFLSNGEIYFKASAGAQRGFDVNVAGALVDDAVDGGETKAGAFARSFRSEKWFKDASLGFRGHAEAGIGDGDKNVLAGLYRRMRLGIFGVHSEVVSFDKKCAAFGHGVGSIDREVEKDLFDLAGIGEDVAEGFTEADAEFDFLAQEALKKAGGVHDELVQVENLWLKQLAAAEGEELSR